MKRDSVAVDSRLEALAVTATALAFSKATDRIRFQAMAMVLKFVASSSRLSIS